MPKKRFSAEQIVTLLRQIEVVMAQGKATPVACREAGISEQSYYRWRKEYGGLELEQAKRMKELERENTRLKRLVADLSLEKQVLEGCRLGKLVSPERRRQAVERHPGEVWSLGTSRLPDRRPAARDAALRHDRPSRRRCADASHHDAGLPVWPLWLSSDHVAACRVPDGMWAWIGCSASGAVRG